MSRIKVVYRHYRSLLRFHVSGLVRSDPKLWVFHGSFEGNTKYLFLWLTLNRPDVKAVWIATSRSIADAVRATGEVAYRYPSLRAIVALARARFHFSGGNGKSMPFRSSRSLLVSLWHGVGIKVIGVGKGRLREALYLKGIHRPNIFVAASKQHAERFAESFELPIANCPILGTPRLDCVLDHALARKSRSASTSSGSLDRQGFSALYLYAPTWREEAGSFLSEAFPEPERLDAALAKRDAVLYVKLHPATLLAKRETAALADLCRSGRRIRVWPADVDFYTVLDQIDCLITDYSSIFADFIYVKDRGLVLYPFDLARYSARRGFHVPYDLIDGVRADTFDRFCEAIASGSAEKAEAPSFHRMRETFWGGLSGTSSPKIVEFVEGLDPHAHRGLAPHPR